MQINLNNLKTVTSIVTKNAPDVLQLWKGTNCGKKPWKTMENTSI